MTIVALNRNRNRSHSLAHTPLATVALLCTAPLYSPSFHLLRVFFFCLFFFWFVRTSLSHITQVMCNTCIICEWGRTEYVWKWDSKRRYKALRNQINETMCLHTVDMLFPLCVPWRLVECECVRAYACHTCTACMYQNTGARFIQYIFIWFGLVSVCDRMPLLALIYVSVSLIASLALTYSFSVRLNYTEFRILRFISLLQLRHATLYGTSSI